MDTRKSKKRMYEIFLVRIQLYINIIHFCQARVLAQKSSDWIEGKYWHSKIMYLLNPFPPSLRDSKFGPKKHVFWAKARDLGQSTWFGPNFTFGNIISFNKWFRIEEHFDQNLEDWPEMSPNHKNELMGS